MASGGSPISADALSSSDTRPGKLFLGGWTQWIGASVKSLAIYFAGLLYYDLHKPSPFPINHVPSTATVDSKTIEIRTAEKAYRMNDRGRFLKRSLRADEYRTLSNGKPLVPLLVVERLKNEAACMSFIKEHTNIPVPKLLDTYEEDGSYYLWTEFVDGIEMSELPDHQQAQVLPQIESIVATLQSLRSSRSGGPTGILSPPSRVYFNYYSEWEQQISPNEEFVFCHCDLAQNNILVDPLTLKITAIIDWEYSGFYPREHEIAFYKSSEFSGRQTKRSEFKLVVDKIVEFWRQSQKSASHKLIPTSY